MKDHFSWYAFLNVRKHLLFDGDGFAGARSIDSAMLSLERETSLQMAPWFWRSIWLAGSWMRRSLWETFFCFVSFTHAQSTSRSKSAYFCLLRMCNAFKSAFKSAFGKFQHKSFSYSQEKSERPCLFLLFPEWQNPELLRGYPYFRNALLIFMNFLNKYGRAVTVGTYASIKNNNNYNNKSLFCSAIPGNSSTCYCRITRCALHSPCRVFFTWKSSHIDHVLLVSILGIAQGDLK